MEEAYSPSLKLIIAAQDVWHLSDASLRLLAGQLLRQRRRAGIQTVLGSDDVCFLSSLCPAN